MTPNPISAIQPWVSCISLMQQAVLLTAIRGPDGIQKYSNIKMLLRWYRRCILISAFDKKILTAPYDHPTPQGGSFTGPSFPAFELFLDGWEKNMDKIVGEYLQTLDAIPHHFHMHFIHAVEILGYKHPDTRIRKWWGAVYIRLVRDLHLFPETEKELDKRLGDVRENWLDFADDALIS